MFELTENKNYFFKNQIDIANFLRTNLMSATFLRTNLKFYSLFIYAVLCPPS